MLTGIVSDSHGNLARLRSALAWLDAGGAQVIIHCGDVGGAEVFEVLAGRDVRFVWGNCDDPTPGLREFVRALGFTLPGPPPLCFQLAGRRIAVFHGHEAAFARVEPAPPYDYLFHGHTHVRRDERRGACRIINPGALHRANPPSAALLNLATDQLTFHEL